MIASVINNISSIAQPKTDKWLGSPSHFSSFFTVYLFFFFGFSLIKGITPKIRFLSFVLINSVRFNLLCV